MNSSFEWIVEPSEDIYNAIKISTALYTASYYYNGFVYSDDDKCYLNLKTGEILSEAPFEIPSCYWSAWSDKVYRDDNENVMLDLSEITNLYRLGDFNNGKAPILFFNSEVSTYYFTLIDEKGNFMFEPVSCGGKSIGRIEYDGEDTIMLQVGVLGADEAICYNVHGELIGELDTDTLSYASWSFKLTEGIVVASGGYNYSYKCMYYNPDFTPLF